MLRHQVHESAMRQNVLMSMRQFRSMTLVTVVYYVVIDTWKCQHYIAGEGTTRYETATGEGKITLSCGSL